MRRAKHAKKNKLTIKKLIILAFILILATSIMAMIGMCIKSKEQNDELNELLSSIKIENNKDNQKTERMLQLEKLKEEYPNVVGWIEIEGTLVNYPVMQAQDNDYYMFRDYKGANNTRGSIFLDKDYDWTIPSSNLLIYGHNNRGDKAMFADLINYKKESFYKEHPIIRFTTPEEDAEYEIISVFLSRVYYKSEKNVFRYYYFINAENEKEYNDYINNAKSVSLYDTGKTAQYGEQLITLTTCEFSQEDGRLVVVGKKK